MGGEDGSLAAGIRLAAEHVSSVDVTVPNNAHDSGDIGLFQLGLVVRWITFDRTGKSWGF